MKKFKVGDRVVLTRYIGAGAAEGVEGSVSEIMSPGECRVKLDGFAGIYRVRYDQMELVEAPKAKPEPKFVDAPQEFTAPPDITRELAYLRGFADALFRESDGDKHFLNAALIDFEDALNAHSIDTRYKFEILQAYILGLGDWRVNQEIQSIQQKIF